MTTPIVTENTLRLVAVDRDTFCEPRPVVPAPWPAPTRRPSDA